MTRAKGELQAGVTWHEAREACEPEGAARNTGAPERREDMPQPMPWRARLLASLRVMIGLGETAAVSGSCRECRKKPRAGGAGGLAWLAPLDDLIARLL
jgi:hypothetical protein